MLVKAFDLNMNFIGNIEVKEKSQLNNIRYYVEPVLSAPVDPAKQTPVLWIEPINILETGFEGNYRTTFVVFPVERTEAYFDRVETKLPKGIRAYDIKRLRQEGFSKIIFEIDKDKRIIKNVVALKE